MIGNQILSSFTPLNPILEGRAFLSLFGPALFLFNGYQPNSVFRMFEGIGQNYQPNIGNFQST